jgi:hypothetical protein
MRHIYGPVARKIADLKLLLHVQQEHDGHSTDAYEYKQYQRRLRVNWKEGVPEVCVRES